jgi:hypothetical protein
VDPHRIVALAKRYDAYERIDGSGDTFRRRARILQSMWRAERGYEAGEYSGRKLGSRLPEDWAECTLSNYLTDTIREVVRCEVEDPLRSRGKLCGKPRIFNDLLSSQPLCFNLFGELQQDLRLATEVLRLLAADRVDRVTAIKFEHSPGRGDREYLGDRSAFDVYVEFTPRGGGCGFIGIEVKYHEDLKGGRPQKDDPRRREQRDLYEQRADEMGCFKPECRADLGAMPLHQIWRDHLLAGRVRIKDRFQDGFFAFLYPEGNPDCAKAIRKYQDCLTPTDTFAAWTLEDVVKAIRRSTAAEWVHLFEDRYLAFSKVDRACGDLGAV